MIKDEMLELMGDPEKAIEEMEIFRETARPAERSWLSVIPDSGSPSTVARYAPAARRRSCVGETRCRGLFP